MRRLLRVAARLYPRAWRDRYGEEFDALIDDVTPRGRDVVNIVAGALIMQRSRLALIPVALAAAGAIIGALVSLAMPPVYASSTHVLVQVAGAADEAGERGQRIRTAIDAALQVTAFDKRAIAVTRRGEPDREPVLLEVSASAASASAAQQAAMKVVGSLIDANIIAAQRLTTNPNVQFRILQPPDLPKTPRRETMRDSAAGAALGVLVGGMVTLVAHRRRRTMA